MRRRDAVELVLKHLASEDLGICCNGMVSREAFDRLDRPGNFYMIGSMGLAASIGLGVALARPTRRVAVLDGDGNVLMNLGTLSEVSALRPQNFYHICFDNEVYGSTGNQPTLSRFIDLAEVARAAGYRSVEKAADPDGLKTALQGLLAQPGPAFLLAKVEVDAEYETAGRVTLSPEAIRDRFMGAAGGIR